MKPAHRFAIATCEELWTRECLEWRVSHGALQQSGTRITATDAADQELLSRAEERLREGRAAIATLPDVRARIVASSRRAGDRVRDDVIIVLSRAGLSLVTWPEHALEDWNWLEMCEAPPARRQVTYRGIPIVWTRGSAAVLFHEGAGHAAEHGAPPLRWPGWISVQDEPAFDDTGAAPRVADLLAGEPPRALRRASFVDVALPRMSSIVVRQQGATMDLPSPRIEISLLSGGSYEPLTDEVSLHVSVAHLIAEGARTQLSPFVIEESRQGIRRSLRGATGEPQRYPGVICSSEGQQLFAASAAPVMLTWF
ncbi:MAG TPA: hypothetical protein VMS98_14315 [Thermoanaerobaculia bacterium]|nr:hypothetical protein [Thermoanaerobaculia bacterium]